MAIQTDEYGFFGNLPKETIDRILGMEGLPAVTGSDNGKVLAVKNGKIQLVAISELVEGLPPVDAEDDGSILMVVYGAWALTELPESTSEPAPAPTPEVDNGNAQ